MNLFANPSAIEATGAAIAGVAVGLAYFALLARNLDLYLGGRALAGAALQAGRFLLVAAVLAGALQFGPLPLITCTLGLLVGRHIILRSVRQVR